MRAHFRHLHFNNFPMIYRTLQAKEFFTLTNLGVLSGLQLPMWEFTCECEGSFPHTFCTFESMWNDSQVSLLARNLATPCLGREPKVKVATFQFGLTIESLKESGVRQCVIGTLLVHRWTIGIHGFTRFTTAWNWGKPTYSPLQYFLCLVTMLAPKCHFVPKLSSWESWNWDSHDFLCIPLTEKKSKKKL